MQQRFATTVELEKALSDKEEEEADAEERETDLKEENEQLRRRLQRIKNVIDQKWEVNLRLYYIASKPDILPRTPHLVTSPYVYSLPIF